jgi:hypothetical protein
MRNIMVIERPRGLRSAGFSTFFQDRGSQSTANKKFGSSRGFFFSGLLNEAFITADYEASRPVPYVAWILLKSWSSLILTFSYAV